MIVGETVHLVTLDVLDVVGEVGCPAGLSVSPAEDPVLVATPWPETDVAGTSLRHVKPVESKNEILEVAV